jgi:hypothetical protein
LRNIASVKSWVRCVGLEANCFVMDNRSEFCRLEPQRHGSLPVHF